MSWLAIDPSRGALLQRDRSEVDPGTALVPSAAWLVPVAVHAPRRRLGLAGSAMVALAVTAAMVALGNLYERRHLSPELDHTLRAALSAASPEKALVAAIRQARPELHTRRDREEFGKLQGAAAAVSASHVSEKQLGRRLQQGAAELDGQLAGQRVMLETELAYAKQGEPVPTTLADAVAQEDLERQDERERQRRAEENAWLALLQQRFEAQSLLQELRVDLRMAAPAPEAP